MKTIEVFVNKEISPEPGFSSVQDIIDQIGGRKFAKLIVNINSPGGDVREGFAIYDYLVGLEKEIETVIQGRCYSIATIIALAGTIRKMTSNSEFMVHNPWGGAQGDADEIKKFAEHLEETETELAKFYSEKLGLSERIIRDLMSNTTFMKPEAAKSYGFITEIVNQIKAVAYFNDNDMKILQRIKNLGKSEKAAEHADIAKETNDGVKLIIVAEDQENLVGAQVFEVDEEGNRTETPLADGTYELTDGLIITVVDGAISEVSQSEPDAKKHEEEEAKAKEKAEKRLVNIEEALEEIASFLEANKESQKENIDVAVKALKKEIEGKHIPPKGVNNIGSQNKDVARGKVWSKYLNKKNK